MAQESWPAPDHNSRAVTDLEYEKVAARFSDDGVYGTPSDSAVVTAGTGLSVNVRADVHASVRGHAWTSGADGDTLAIIANPGSSTRIDWVVLRLDRSTWTVRAVIVGGTPGAGAPALTQDTGDTGVYEVPLARVTVLAGASSVTVTRAEQYVGARTRPCTSTTRNPNPLVGETCFETDTGVMRVWTGSSWQVIYDDSGVVGINAPTSAWANEVESVLQARNGAVHLRLGSFSRAGGTLADEIESRLPAIIPAAYRHPTRDQYVPAMVGGAAARIIVYSASNSSRPGQVWLTNKPNINTGAFVLPMSGISWVV